MNTVYILVKRILIALMVGILSSYAVYSQSSGMQWTVNVDNLNVGGIGTITIKGENTSNSVIAISKITLPDYQGIEILHSPDPIIKINDNLPVGGDFSTSKQYVPYEAIQPHSSIELTYSVAATCEAIYEVGDSVNVLASGKVFYSNRTEENLDRTSFSVSYPRLQLWETRKVISEENQMDLVLKIVNLMQDVPAQGIQFNINFTDNAQPLTQEMYANISNDGTHWSNPIWPGNSYSNPSEFNFTNAELQNMGMEGLQYGDTLYVKISLQLNPSTSNYSLDYEILFSDVQGNYCSDKKEQGTISIVRQTGTPNLTITQKVLNRLDFCIGTKSGVIQVTVKNIGDGVAYIKSINLGSTYVEPISAKIGDINILGTSGKVSFPFTNIDGTGGLEDINNDGIFSELAAGDSVNIMVEYMLKTSVIRNNVSYYTLNQKIEYVSLNNEMLKTVSSTTINGGVSVTNRGIIGADVVNLLQSDTYEYVLNLQTFEYSMLLDNNYSFYFLARASDGITINGSSDDYYGTFSKGKFSETLQLQFNENLSPCSEYYLNIFIGIKNDDCGQTISLGNIRKEITIENNVLLKTDVNDVLLTDFSVFRTNYGWKLSDVNNLIPTKEDLDLFPKLTKDTSPASNIVSNDDTVKLTLCGQYNIVDNTTDVVSATIFMDYQHLEFVRATYKMGDQERELIPTKKQYSNDLYFRIPTANLGFSQDSIRIDVWCKVFNASNTTNNISAYLQMEKTGVETAYNTCLVTKKQEIVEIRRTSSITTSTNICNSTVLISSSSGYSGEYNPNMKVDKITILREDGLSLKQNEITVSIGSIDIPFYLDETTEKYEIHFDDTLLLDVSTHQKNLVIRFKPRFLSYESSSKRIPIQIGEQTIRYITLSDNPIISISRPDVSSTQTRTVSWDVSLSGNRNNMNLYFKWFSDQLRLISVKTLTGETLVNNETESKSLFFNFPFTEGTSVLTFIAEVQNCANNDTLRSLLQAAIECNEIEETAFDTLALEYYNRDLDVKVNSISLPVTQPTFETQYINLCDTAYYSFQISNIGADTSNVSFWLDNISENVEVKNVNATIGSETYQLGNYTNPSGVNITTDVLRNTSTDNIDEAYTVVNVGLSVECDPTRDFIDVTNPVNAHVLRNDICNNPIEEVFHIQPRIKGFENMDSIRFTANVVNFDNQGIGTVTVSLQNRDFQLIDSVDFTAILPEGLEYVENSTTPNYFSSVQRNGQNVVWAFERNKHVEGNENLQFTFQIRNTNRCEQNDFALKMATSLERTLHGSCGSACLVKKTSDTVLLNIQQEQIHLIESITPDKNSVCAGDSFSIIVQENNNGIFTLLAEPADMVSITENTIVTNPLVSGLVTIKASATDGDCQDEVQTTVTINALPQLQPLETKTIEKGVTEQLSASPIGGIWSGTDVESSGLFRSDNSGVHTIYYTVTNGDCSNTDSVQITVFSCDKEIFIEPDSLKVSEQTSIITIPVSISPIEECGYCSELRSMKFNVTFDNTVLDYESVELLQMQGTVDVYDKVENNTVVVQMYSNTKNGFVTQGDELLYLSFIVKRPENTDVSVSKGYYNGENISENFTDDKVHIFFMPKPTIILHDTVLCSGNQIELVPIVDNPSKGELRYDWNVRQTTPSIVVSKPGDYVVSVYDNYGSYDSKHIVVSEAPAIVAELADATICDGSIATILPYIVQGEVASYEWNTGEKTSSINVSYSGTYSVTMTDIYGCTSEISANVTVNENSEIPVFSYNRNNMDSYTATISNGIENNVYMWYGSDGITFESNQSSSVTISVSSYPATICVESQDENGCTSVLWCDTIPLTPPISILGNRVLCKSDIGFEWQRQQYNVESPNPNSEYVWTLSDNTMAEIEPVSNGVIQIRSYAGVQGDVELIVQERQNGVLINEGRETLQIRVQPQYDYFVINGPQEWNSLCPFATDVQYSVTPQGEYFWTVFNDAQITSGQGTDHVTIDFGEMGSSIEVRRQNGEGCVSFNPITTWVGTGATDCGSLKSFTIEEDVDTEIKLLTDGEDLRVIIYPEPIQYVMNIKANAEIEMVSFYTATGSEVLRVYNKTQIDVSSLTSGNYVIEIKTDKGVATQTIMVVR